MNRRILVVDDHPTNRKLAAALLEFAGHDVATAANAEEALAAIRAAPPALVLLDLQLPGMDGLGLAQRLRAEPATARLRLVALSALAMPAEIERALAAGCDGYITKPVDAERFPAQVEAFLSSASQPVAPP